ncbi:hypothetical protein ZIOFF_018571 [Zingiber officinale]|uniref:Protein FAR1-RELATED SEQUENCE n=1 Tax=Zingiber officinale TaxID=94328 RepID=A0A8J5H8E4_ZINOF|nr:hypothetical protein ZIOFF_018571 [Zingiber officinale]
MCREGRSEVAYDLLEELRQRKGAMKGRMHSDLLAILHWLCIATLISSVLCEETIMEEGKFDSNEMKDNTDHADQDLSPSTVEEVKLPEIGMVFSSEEEIRTFYNSYATSVGFGISKHVIKVLMRMKVIEVPMSYIMDLWRKDIKRGYQSISNIYDGYGCSEKRLRYNTLTRLMQEVQQLGAESDEICSVLVEIMKDTKEKLIIAMENGQSRAGQFEEASTSELGVLELQMQSVLEDIFVAVLSASGGIKVNHPKMSDDPFQMEYSGLFCLLRRFPTESKGRQKKLLEDGDWDWRFAYGRVVWIMGFACWFAILALVVHCGRKKLEYRVLPTLHIRVYELFDCLSSVPLSDNLPLPEMEEPRCGEKAVASGGGSVVTECWSRIALSEISVAKPLPA